MARNIQPSPRGELEITSVNKMYLDTEKLGISILERGTMWMDTGTFESLSAASSYVKVVEERQGNMISCLEEIAWRNGWIDDAKLQMLSAAMGGNEYSRYLYQLVGITNNPINN
jgi:glucose-1-phosphate thymidylyltransferase